MENDIFRVPLRNLQNARERPIPPRSPAKRFHLVRSKSGRSAKIVGMTETSLLSSGKRMILPKVFPICRARRKALCASP